MVKINRKTEFLVIIKAKKQKQFFTAVELEPEIIWKFILKHGTICILCT